jgi:two-component system LytT family sensor kinase
MNWLEMIVKLIGAIALIDVVAVLLASTHSFAKLDDGKSRLTRHILLGLTGGLFAIYATVAGYKMTNSEAQVSIRDVGALLGGALGGPLGGLIAGTMGGVFRLFWPWISDGSAGSKPARWNDDSLRLLDLCHRHRERFLA